MIVSITLLGSLIRLQVLHFCHSCKFSFFGRVTTREQVHVCGHSSSSSFSSAWTSFFCYVVYSSGFHIVSDLTAASISAHKWGDALRSASLGRFGFNDPL